MLIKIIGIKIGMSSFFDNLGILTPITIIKILDNYIINIKKNINNLDYIQITSGIKNKNKVNNSIIGHYKKSNILPGIKIIEFKINTNSILFEIGQKISINNLIENKTVDITGISKGKGFTGVIKRWNFKTQDASHGNSLSHRAPGSIGQNQTPGRVFKGKKMAGHKGNSKITIKGNKIINFDIENKYIYVKGSVPGSNNSILILKCNYKI